jgi:hypothetical protein
MTFGSRIKDTFRVLIHMSGNEMLNDEIKKHIFLLVQKINLDTGRVTTN